MVKWTGRETNYSSPSSSEVTNESRYTPTIPYVVMNLLTFTLLLRNAPFHACYYYCCVLYFSCSHKYRYWQTFQKLHSVENTSFVHPLSVSLMSISHHVADSGRTQYWNSWASQIPSRGTNLPPKIVTQGKHRKAPLSLWSRILYGNCAFLLSRFMEAISPCRSLLAAESCPLTLTTLLTGPSAHYMNW